MLPPETPPANLLAQIQQKIQRAERRARVFKFVGNSVFLLLAIALLIPAASFIGAEIQQTGFSSLLSLLYSDWSVVAGNWHDYLLALAETIPLVAVSGFLGAGVFLLWSMNRWQQNLFFKFKLINN